jgi:hypothetical protein
LATAEHESGSRIEPKGPERVKEKLEEIREPKCGVELSIISVFSRVSQQGSRAVTAAERGVFL